MARYSRIRGPNPAFEVTAANPIVPGMIITRYWDDGEILIILSSEYQNVSGAASTCTYILVLDGVAIGPAFSTPSVPNGGELMTSAHRFAPVQAGNHEIRIQVSGAAAAGDVLTLDGTELTVIQLPLWDDSAQLITL